MASVIAKKSSKVDPLIQKNDTEMTDLGLPPSTADLNKLLLDSGENSDTNNNSSLAAFTEETEADDSRRNSGSNSQGNDVDLNSSRSSTPRSNTPGGLKRIKRNTVVPIHEETSFGVDTKSYETGKIDSGRPPSVQAWSESSGSGADVRPGTAPTNVTPHQEGSKTSRPNTAPMSPRSLVRSNKVTPISSPSSTPVKRSSVNSDRKPSGGKSLLDETISEDQDNTLSEPIYNAKEISKKKSNEAADFNKEDEKTDAPEKSLVELDARHVSVQSAEAVLAPPIASGDHSAYIPVEYAKEYIQRVIEDMKKMKANHYEVVEKIQQQYQLIEEESQAQFNAYVIKLRGEYTTKVSVFKQVIEAHQTEFTTKQKFYEEAIKSLREKNRQLLLQRKQFLLKAKDANTKHEEEKTEIITDLTGMLDQKHKEYISLHKKYSEEKSTKENFQTKNSELKSEIENLKMKLNFSSGEGQKIIEELTELRKENEDLSTRLKNTETEKDSIVEEKGKLDEQSNEKTNIIEEMKTKLNEQDSKIVELQSKVDTIEGKDKEMSDLQIKIEECEKQIKMLEERPVAPQPVVTMETQLNTDSNQQQSESSIEEVAILQAKVNTLEDKLKNFEATERQTNDSDLEAEINMLRNENNIAKMELLNVQEKNQLLHRRLETMLNEVMDTVNVDHISVKVNELSEQKITLENEVSKINEAIGDWKQQYQHEHNEQEPNENDRPDTVRDLFTQIKTKSENIKMLEKNITVLHMLLDGTLPDDMKQQENATVSEDSMLDELRKQHHEEVARLKNIIDGLKEKEVKTVEKIVEVPINSTNIIENDSSSVIINELTAALQETQSRIEEIERERNEELEAQKKAAHRLEKKLAKEQSGVVKLENEKRDLESQIRIGQESNEAEKKLQQETLDKVKKELEKLNAEKLAKFPVKAKAEIKTLQEKIKSLEASTDGNSKELLDLKTQNASLNEDVRNLKIQLEALQAKEAELQKLGETEKKYKELKKKYKALEAKKVVTKTITTPAGSTSSAGTGADPEEVKKLKNKISELETQLADGLSAPSSTSLSKKDSKIDPKAMLKLEKSNELLKEKVESMKKSAQTDADKIKELQDKLKESKTAGSDKNSKKKEKELKDLQKKFESEQKKTAKFKEDLDKTKEEIADAKKELDAAQGELKKNKEEITSLGVAAKEGLEAMEKVSELTKSNKELSEENKTLAENFNSERILRKKYYNMVEDMKGKIRVYARARPMSRSELDRGNHTIISSPDEYSLIVQTARGPKDFQYDAVFTPDHNQEKVFEDTNNLIQSAVDGYNVCIFAYGQTGSGKTFTMIGDKEQKFPGIAPRSFKAIYALIEENKTKFDFQTSMYMMELYRDNLIDLFGDHKDPAKLDIKKDKKGMVIVSGAVIKQATNSDELMSIFEKGSESRHVASTKMNSESSRSHLILSIIIESTNKTSGAVTKGKLSLVDLAGSERANKTGATAEQLKEAQSINKSLSALGDVISALSSEQSFIPYRNNKLTLLMQDSLGGNAKTLMFVNISPADYNCDETITSLTYASRVKLITNDASKNADNKEISRLKGIISKLKKGESVDEDVE